MSRKTLLRHQDGRYRVRELGRFIEAHQGRRFGKPTFKGTRVEVKEALYLLAEGKTVAEVAAACGVSCEAIQEALYLSAEMLTNHLRLPHPLDEPLAASSATAAVVGKGS
jgi:uncharacterized protein (DUF433 family)